MARSCGCNEFSRRHLLESTAAEAGRGLPAIEPGMPKPAGTGLSRRSFMLRSGALLLSVYGASRLGLGQLSEGVAEAAGTADPVLVTVFMDGGIDGLSVLAPVEDPVYRRLRPTLALDPDGGTPFAEDSRLRWHPAAGSLNKLHRQGKLSVMPAVGYAHANQSHFTSRHYWEVGSLSATEPTGWLGRLLDVIGTPDNPLQGLSLDGHLSPVLAPKRVPVAAVDGPRYDLWAPGVWGDVEDLMFGSMAALGGSHAAGMDPARAQAGYVATQAMDVRRRLRPFADRDITPPVPYPDGGDESFPDNMAALAALLAAGLPIRCVALSGPGFYDTHEDQRTALSTGLKLTADSLAAFQRDLESRGIADRVVTLIWSEFGRRPEQNASNGTDHGAGGVGFVMGSRVRGRMLGEFPGLAKLDEDDNVRPTLDFRALYCSVLEQWLHQDASRIIPGAAGFQRPRVIA